MDCLAKLIYLPFATWKVGATAKNEIVQILNDVLAPIGEVVYGISELSRKVGDGLQIAGKAITWQADYGQYAPAVSSEVGDVTIHDENQNTTHTSRASPAAV
jgi:hypothetical protein